jgi:hypothetical protein
MSFDATGVITNADGSYAKLLDTISAASIHVCTGTKFTYLTNNVVTFQSDNCLVLFSVGERTHSLIKFEVRRSLCAPVSGDIMCSNVV